MASQPRNLQYALRTHDGDRLQALRVLRNRLARDIDNCGSLRDLGTLSARFVTVLAEIDALERDPQRITATDPQTKATAEAGGTAGDPADDLARARAARRAAAKDLEQAT